MVTIKVYSGDQLVKEITVNYGVDEVEARLTAEPYDLSFEVGGSPYVIKTLVHPTARPVLDDLLKKASKNADAEDDDTASEETDEGENTKRYQRLMELLNELGEEDEDEEDEDASVKSAKAQKDAQTAQVFQQIFAQLAELTKAIEELKATKGTGHTAKERKTPVVLKSWAPYERVPRFEEQDQPPVTPQITRKVDEHGLSDFQKAFLKRLFGQE